MKPDLTSESRKNLTEEMRTFGSLLRRPYQALLQRVYAEPAISGFEDIRPAHSSVFRNILPGGSRITELAEAAQMTKQSMGYLVDSLREGGYVETTPDPSDGRAKLVQLTEKGRAVQEAALVISRKAEEELGELVGREEMAQLHSLLEQLNDVLERES